eukprot:5016081-Pleurochrysis_carterae.AAC.5
MHQKVAENCEMIELSDTAVCPLRDCCENAPRNTPGKRILKGGARRVSAVKKSSTRCRHETRSVDGENIIDWKTHTFRQSALLVPAPNDGLTSSSATSKFEFTGWHPSPLLQYSMRKLQ